MVEAPIEQERAVSRVGTPHDLDAAAGIGSLVRGAVKGQQGDVELVGVRPHALERVEQTAGSAGRPGGMIDERVARHLGPPSRIARERLVRDVDGGEVRGQRGSQGGGRGQERRAVDAKGRGEEDETRERGMAREGEQGDDRPADARSDEEDRSPGLGAPGPGP